MPAKQLRSKKMYVRNDLYKDLWFEMNYVIEKNVCSKTRCSKIEVMFEKYAPYKMLITLVAYAAHYVWDQNLLTDGRPPLPF